MLGLQHRRDEIIIAFNFTHIQNPEGVSTRAATYCIKKASILTLSQIFY
jgi:hypothetical protein